MFRSAAVLAIFLLVAALACATPLTLSTTLVADNCMAGPCSSDTSPYSGTYTLISGPTGDPGTGKISFQYDIAATGNKAFWSTVGQITEIDISYYVADPNMDPPAKGTGTGKLNVDADGLAGTSFSLNYSKPNKDTGCTLVTTGAYAGDCWVSTTINVQQGTTAQGELSTILTWLQDNGHLRYEINPTGASGNAFALLGAPQIVIDYTESASTIPEPASFALIGLGLVGIATLRKRFTR